MKLTLLNRIFSLVTALLLIAGVAIRRDAKTFGHDWQKPLQDTLSITDSLLHRTSTEGYQVISSQIVASHIIGYNGPIPLDLYLDDNRIVRITPLENQETPRFFEALTQAGLFDRWNGMTLEEAINAPVDAISGSTFSSDAVIQGVRETLRFYGVKQEQAKWYRNIDTKWIVTMLVILAALILPLRIRSQRYRIIQLMLNVIVLGFWSSSFLSLQLLTSVMANGWTSALSGAVVLLLAGAFLWPLFGRKNHYCLWVCPLGSAQELMGKITRRKLPISTRVASALEWVRRLLWMGLLAFMWLGVGFYLMDYELFTAFLFQQASTTILIAAGLFLVLSCFVTRPYCRFVCPTGTLLKFAQNDR